MTPLPPDILATISTYLSTPLPLSPPPSPLSLLSTYLLTLPPTVLRDVGSYTTPRERAAIPAIKARRTLYATSAPTLLSAQQGRLRWPLLWERMGGDPRVVAATLEQDDEAAWAAQSFMPGQTHYVGRLPRLLRENQEVREWEDARAARALERTLDNVGEEFDDEDDEVDEDAGVGGDTDDAVPYRNPLFALGVGEQDQIAVEQAFERRLLELYIDGLDRVDYADVDFNEPANDPIGARDAEDAWFDDEAPSAVDSSRAERNGHANGIANGHTEAAGLELENGQGEYDY